MKYILIIISIMFLLSCNMSNNNYGTHYYNMTDDTLNIELSNEQQSLVITLLPNETYIDVLNINYDYEILNRENIAISITYETDICIIVFYEEGQGGMNE